MTLFKPSSMSTRLNLVLNNDLELDILCCLGHLLFCGVPRSNSARQGCKEVEYKLLVSAAT